METSRYFDAVNFAARRNAHCSLGVGLLDVAAPAGCVYAAFNQAPGPKEIVPMPQADHKRGHEEIQKRRSIWLKALAAGEAVPVAGP